MLVDTGKRIFEVSAPSLHIRGRVLSSEATDPKRPASPPLMTCRNVSYEGLGVDWTDGDNHHAAPVPPEQGLVTCSELTSVFGEQLESAPLACSSG